MAGVWRSYQALMTRHPWSVQILTAAGPWRAALQVDLCSLQAASMPSLIGQGVALPDDFKGQVLLSEQLPQCRGRH
ncbi:unnamed protein product [Arctogadus glacialis]